MAVVPKLRPAECLGSGGGVTLTDAGLRVLLVWVPDARSAVEPLLLGLIPTVQNQCRPWESLYFFT